MASLQASLRWPPVPESLRRPARSSRENERAEEADEEAKEAEESWWPQANDPVGALMLAAAKLNELHGPGADAPHKTKTRKNIFSAWIRCRRRVAAAARGATATCRRPAELEACSKPSAC